MRILLIEDDEAQGRFLVEELAAAGHSTQWATTGLAGLQAASASSYDVLILDRLLPELDGLAVLKSLRESGNRVPALILSALSSVDERVQGLKAGGDDYLCKPFAVSELLARLEALVRRPTRQAAETKLVLGDLEMDLLARTVKRGGRDVALQNREFRLLEYLMRHAGQVVTRTMLLEEVWNFHFDPGTNVVDAQISKLRQKLDRDQDRAMINTIRGVGYRLDA